MSRRAAAHRNPDDPPVPEIGDEFSAGRALVDLGERLPRARRAGRAGRAR
ncbi:dsRBD fold-containing protein [Kitasatospora humi]|nr:dsRBD fold-containing protein [Kitasatospora humi]